MIKVQIAGIEQKLSDLSESWIHEQIRVRQKDGLPVCVRVFVKYENIDLVLTSGECPTSSSSGRKANSKESGIFDLWEKFKLKEAPINSGRLIAFLQKVKDLA
tara:strand:+ start:690 stop:998 length:309 start_codon:yes stop_codon:yes gene_type:complete